MNGGRPGLHLVVTVRLTSGGFPVMESWSVMTLLNDGSGTFAQPSNPSSALNGPWTGRIAARLAELDADSKLDLVVLDGIPPPNVSSTMQPAVKEFFGDATGHFGSVVSVTVPKMLTTGIYAYTDCNDAKPIALSYSYDLGELGVADLNGDGRGDLFSGENIFLSGARTVGSVGRMEGRGVAGGAGIGAPNTSDGTLSPVSTGPAAADLDGDGKFEVINLNVAFGAMATMPTATVKVGRVNPAGVYTW